MTAPGPTSSLELAAAARRIQLALRARLLVDVTRLWPLLDASRLRQTRPGWLQAMREVTLRYHAMSSQAGAAYYGAAKRLQLDIQPSAGIIRLAPPPADEWMLKAYDYAGPRLLERESIPESTALSTTLGTAARITVSGGNVTIVETAHADPDAVGWYRITDGDPCAFCALLASRGVVYKEDTADFKAHNLCGCTAAPAFSRDQDLPELSRIAERIYTEKAAGAGTGKQLAAFRKAWAEHQSTSRSGGGDATPE